MILCPIKLCITVGVLGQNPHSLILNGTLKKHIFHISNFRVQALFLHFDKEEKLLLMGGSHAQ